ncbi:MAG TPA: sigma-70 family RNA polymerase sigma factor [Baekduia sp.]|uniref:RNA polymerase sigma factor n=1 Tax=Baekduia sp. TaxID=2600305 RepID=UPI002D79045F|nr:sigma-70 family RNA polymerase sigma factor [Baekduia sp.]HET6507747.1 sigma-70 family RNA polymerase sigma factor [Baekduia sp.]
MSSPVLSSPKPNPARPRVPRAGSASDEALVAATRAGSDAAFTAIVQRYEAPLVAYARQVLGGHHHDAEECVQDAFVRALSSLRRNDAEIALRPWLHAIVRNRCLDQLRKPQRTTDLEPMQAVLADHGPGPVSMIAHRQRLSDVVDGMEALPERQRRALVMHELEDRSHSQIGRVLGVSAGASKALVCRARQGVAAALGGRTAA